MNQSACRRLVPGRDLVIGFVPLWAQRSATCPTRMYGGAVVKEPPIYEQSAAGACTGGRKT